MKLKRISEPAVSPDGQWVAFTVMTVDVENNARPRQIYIVPSGGGIPKASPQPDATNVPNGRPTQGA